LASSGTTSDWLYAGDAVYLMQVDGFPPTLYTLLRVPTDGSAPVTMYSEPTGHFPGGLASDGTNVYWSVRASGTVTVWSLPLGAPAGTARTPVFHPAVQASWLRIRNGSFYWTSNVYPEDTGVYSRSLTPVGDAGDNGTQIVTDNTYGDFAVTDDALYWVTNPSGTVSLRTAPIAGGNPKTVTGVVGSPAPMSVDGTYVYWTVTYNTSITGEGVYRYTAGGSVEPVVSAGHYSAYGLLVSGQLAYFGISSTSTVYSVPKSGGSPVAIADAGSGFYGFPGADAQFIYGVSPNGGPLIKIPR
jgi:hypothetical protein